MIEVNPDLSSDKQMTALANQLEGLGIGKFKAHDQLEFTLTEAF